MASKAINTGVEQGDENIPPNTPAVKAPKKPLLLFFDNKFVEGLIFIIPIVCKDIIIIKIPNIKYQDEDDVPISLPADVAIIPNIINVTAVPTENTREYKNAFFVFVFPTPPTYPITKGMLEREQGVKDVIIPAKRASTGANQVLFFIISAI